MCRLNLWVRCGRAAGLLALLPPRDHETPQYPPLQQGLSVQHFCDADGHTPPLRRHTKAQRLQTHLGRFDLDYGLLDIFVSEITSRSKNTFKHSPLQSNQRIVCTHKNCHIFSLKS